MAHPFIPNPSQPRIAVENVLGIALQVGLPPTGDPDNGRCPQDLRAISWPDGKRIDLKWTVPKDILGDSVITRIIIKRSQLGHSAFLTDDHELIYDGPSIEHFIDGKKVLETLGGPVGQQTPPDLEIGIPATGEDLHENTYYYYTLYMTVAEEPIGIYDFGLEAQSNCQVTGLSIIDYLGHPERGKFYGEYFYGLFSSKVREKDQAEAAALGRERGYFQDFCHFIQGGLNILRGNAQALEQLTDVDRLPAGLVGRAFDQSTILGAWARRFAIPPERFILDVEILRRIAASMIFLYKEKGTCPGLVDFTKVLTQWDSTCTEFDSGVGPCNPIYLETWDTDTVKARILRQASLVVSVPGSLTIPGAGFTIDAHTDSLLVGPMFDQIQIDSNTADTLVFEDATAEVRVEDLITIDSVAAVGGDIYTLEITRTAGGPSEANDSEYNGYHIVDSANVSMTVQATEYIGVGSPSTVTVDSPGGAPSTGSAAVAFNYVLGAAFANRDPVAVFCVWTGCPTFLYDPLMDVTLRDIFTPDVVNPHDVLYSGGILIGVAFQPGDTILTIQSGIAKFVGNATDVVGNTLTDTSANFGPNGTNEFHFLNPNQNQKRTWRIISNTATTLTVEPDIPGVTLEQVAAAGSRYAVLELKANRFYEILARLAELFIPVTSRLFIFFEE
jgi:hypothetical protein